MDSQNFEKILDERVNKIIRTLRKKGKEYSSDKDRLHNFKVAARISESTPETALCGMFIKHLVSVLDIVNDLENGKLPSSELVDEKIGDSINYLILLEALLKERLTHNEKN